MTEKYIQRSLELRPWFVNAGKRLVKTPKIYFADVCARLKIFREDYGPSVLPGYVVHPGDVRLPLAPGVTALPFAEL